MKDKMTYGLFAAALLLTACGTTEETTEDTAPAEEAVEQPAEEPAEEQETTEPAETEDAAVSEEAEATDGSIRAMYTAPHGNQSFASTFVVMDGDTVHDVAIDEYQFMEGDDWDGVPNADETFGEGYAEELTLVSKRENDEDYSAMMADIADATNSYSENLDAIQDFAIGKTLSEIEEAIAELDGLGEDDEIADVVSGATFVDTNGYLQAIVDTANDGLEFPGAADADLANAELSYSLEAPHGNQSFAIVAVLHEGDSVLAAAMDELQFVDPAEFEGVPNSDETFGENYNEDVVLASKLENDEAYSAMMADIAGATMTYSENMQSILDFAVGKTADEIEAAADEVENLGEDDEIADVVSGATFVDTDGYLQAIADTMDE